MPSSGSTRPRGRSAGRRTFQAWRDHGRGGGRRRLHSLQRVHPRLRFTSPRARSSGACRSKGVPYGMAVNLGLVLVGIEFGILYAIGGDGRGSPRASADVRTTRGISRDHRRHATQGATTMRVPASLPGPSGPRRVVAGGMPSGWPWPRAVPCHRRRLHRSPRRRCNTSHGCGHDAGPSLAALKLLGRRAARRPETPPPRRPDRPGHRKRLGRCAVRKQVLDHVSGREVPRVPGA